MPDDPTPPATGRATQPALLAGRARDRTARSNARTALPLERRRGTASLSPTPLVCFALSARTEHGKTAPWRGVGTWSGECQGERTGN